MRLMIMSLLCESTLLSNTIFLGVMIRLQFADNDQRSINVITQSDFSVTQVGPESIRN